MSETIACDICVIGAGSGGLSVAAGAVQMGASVVLLEGGKMGGDCLNYGCVPSKALLAAAKTVHVKAVAPTPADYAAAKDHVAAAIAAIAPHDSQERFEGLGVRVIREYGRFTGRAEVQAGPHRIRARRFVIATGSSPLVPPIPGLDQVPYETNETIFDLRERPEHMLIIGGGPIGIEMAQAHVRLGSKVTVIEGLTALNRDDPEAAAIVLKEVRAEGVEIAESCPVERIEGSAGAIRLFGSEGRVFEGSHLLVAVGRRANIADLGLKAAGIEADRVVKVDRHLKTTNRRVYAIGDAAGGPNFTHVAGYHAGVVVRSALFGLPAKVRTDHIPWVTYTDPELAHVGLSEAEARKAHGDRLEVLRVDYSQADRATATGRTDGLVKVMVVRGRPVGASIAGDQAGELIAFWSLAIADAMKMSEISAMIAPYPTLSDLHKRAVSAYFTPRLFENTKIKHIVRAVQRFLP